MPKKRKLDPIFGCFWLLIGIAGAVDISLENPYDGFFLKDIYYKKQVTEPNAISKTFVINQPSNTYRIQAQDGPFESHQTVPQDLVDAVQFKSRKNNSLMHRTIINNMDVSAHIVSAEISPKLPRLQVLIHATPHVKTQTNEGESRQNCAQVFVDAGDIEISGVCILDKKDGVCVVGLDLHKEWWSANGTFVRISYSILDVGQNSQCASASNSIIPARSLSSGNESVVNRQLISALHLTVNEKSYDEWKDQDILIDVPRELFHQGDSFEIPIRLEASSDLQVFVMRARVRQGLRITGARMTDPSSQWSIQVDIKDHQKTGTVTAFVRDARVYKKSKRVQDVFRWQMEVAEDTYHTNLGRIVWSIEYQRSGMTRESYIAQDSKIISTINIRSKDQQRLVPVLKVNEILNLAILTGREQVYPLKIFAVDDSENYKDVTSQTKCHSVEVDVLKVAADCTSVYVNGAESRGSHNVSVIAKSGQATAFMDVAVWIPEDRLDIQVSDTRLSRIRNWKIPSHDARKRRSITDPVTGGPVTKKAAGRNCELKHQLAVVDVYTKFYIQTPKQSDFYMGPSSYLKVTDLVKGRLRMSDMRIATLSGNLIKAKQEGRTEIQLLSPRNGHVLSAREIRVSHDKVGVRKLHLRLVTGLALFVEPSDRVDGALEATAVVQDQLLSEFQEGIIDVEVEFTDMTRLPLRYISSEDYFLETKTMNHNIVGIISPSETPYQPHIVALGEGSADLIKVVLKLCGSCSKRKTQPLATTYMNLDIDFSKEASVFSDTQYQSDAHSNTNRASGRWGEEKPRSQNYLLHSPEFENKDFPKTKFSKNNYDTGDDEMKVLVVNDFIEELAADVGGDGSAKQEPLHHVEGEALSPLQIGMFVLLGVFLVALTVFLVNCFVFMVRYKRKQKPKKARGEAISNANDWVWIGRATLERNSVYTRQSRSLMPDEDFNGNQTSRPSSCSSASSEPSGGPASAPGSNRNSTVSTYKGSECSIRITTNPITEDGAPAGAVGGAVEEETRSECSAPQWDYEAMGMNYEQLLKYFDNLKESTA